MATAKFAPHHQAAYQINMSTQITATGVEALSFTALSKGSMEDTIAGASLVNNEKVVAALSRLVDEPPASSSVSPLVMIVDDEPLARTVLAILLESKGYRVIVATDGLDALRLYPRHRRQVATVITDMVMPHLDGPGLVRALKRLDPGLNIIVHSGSVILEKANAVCDGQLFAFLPKPCENSELLRTVAAGVAGRFCAQNIR